MTTISRRRLAPLHPPPPFPIDGGTAGGSPEAARRENGPDLTGGLGREAGDQALRGRARASLNAIAQWPLDPDQAEAAFPSVMPLSVIPPDVLPMGLGLAPLALRRPLPSNGRRGQSRSSLRTWPIPSPPASSRGVMYEQGRGVAQNYRDAMRWFRLAAVQGNASAQSNLGVMYYKGQVSPRTTLKR